VIGQSRELRRLCGESLKVRRLVCHRQGSDELSGGHFDLLLLRRQADAVDGLAKGWIGRLVEGNSQRLPPLLALDPKQGFTWSYGAERAVRLSLNLFASEVDRSVIFALDPQTVKAGGRMDRLTGGHLPAFRPELDTEAGLHGCAEDFSSIVDEMERRQGSCTSCCHEGQRRCEEEGRGDDSHRE
jgi:hypothetical protein